jgi:Fur family ferric uptake transcriptional regulator
MDPLDVLVKHNLKRTSCREGILELMLSSDQALSENEIKQGLSGNYDRTTFYRSFKTLEEKRIIHKIVVDNNLVKYALDNSVTFKHAHAHFFCRTCEMVRCLDSVPVKMPVLPNGYSCDESEFILKGTCNLCSGH